MIVPLRHVYFLVIVFTPLLVKAATGLTGGDLSHEFHVIADIGEDTVVTCPK